MVFHNCITVLRIVIWCKYIIVLKFLKYGFFRKNMKCFSIKSFLWVIIKYNWDYDKHVFEIFFTFKFLDIIMLELFLRIAINKIKIPKIYNYTH